ncbi:MAG: TetR family transcriptional regulator [Gammaproteobacteria bacterium]|nr:TetR/AcrR family transcriptional regulator [Gammaproteobacteria bacterium]NNJ98352.1 TetR family transcriptional regulator [Gammaproteobacteria bacterium]
MTQPEPRDPARAGVSKQTVYSHFKNNEDLFRTCIKNKVEPFGFQEEEMAAHPSDARKF